MPIVQIAWNWVVTFKYLAGLKCSLPVTCHINSKLLCCWLDNFCLLRSYLFSCCCFSSPLLCLEPF